MLVRVSGWSGPSGPRRSPGPSRTARSPSPGNPSPLRLAQRHLQLGHRHRVADRLARQFGRRLVQPLAQDRPQRLALLLLRLAGPGPRRPTPRMSTPPLDLRQPLACGRVPLPGGLVLLRPPPPAARCSRSPPAGPARRHADAPAPPPRPSPAGRAAAPTAAPAPPAGSRYAVTGSSASQRSTSPPAPAPGVAVRRLQGHRLQAHRLQRRRHRRLHLPRRREESLPRRLRQVAVGERHPAGQQFVQRRPEAVHVGRRAEWSEPPVGLLRGHVRRRAHAWPATVADDSPRAAPQRRLGRLGAASSPPGRPPGRPTTLARPQSTTSVSPYLPSMTLPGFRSRCTRRGCGRRRPRCTRPRTGAAGRGRPDASGPRRSTARAPGVSEPPIAAAASPRGEPHGVERPAVRVVAGPYTGTTPGAPACRSPPPPGRTARGWPGRRRAGPESSQRHLAADLRVLGDEHLRPARPGRAGTAPRWRVGGRGEAAGRRGRCVRVVHPSGRRGGRPSSRPGRRRPAGASAARRCRAPPASSRRTVRRPTTRRPGSAAGRRRAAARCSVHQGVEQVRPSSASRAP